MLLTAVIIACSAALVWRTIVESLGAGGGGARGEEGEEGETGGGRGR